MAAETGKARLPTDRIVRLKDGTISWLEFDGRCLEGDGTSATRVEEDDRYTGALPFTARYGEYGYFEEDALWDTKQAKTGERVRACVLKTLPRSRVPVIFNP